MNQVKFVSKSAGRCATEYVREDLDQVLPRYHGFVYRDQNNGLPTKMEARPTDLISSRFTTQLGYGTYGVESDGTLTLLASCIDSSD